MKEEEIKIRNELQNLRLQSRNRYLELRGKEFVEKYQAIRKEVDKEYDKLVAELHNINRRKMKAQAEKQAELMKVNRSQVLKKALLDLEKHLAEIDIQVFTICGCGDTKPADYTYHGLENEDIIKEFPTGYENNIEVTGPYNEGLMQAQPYVSIKGFPGANFKGSIGRYFVFTYKPEETKKYCIKPDIYLSGYWFLWPFNSGGCGTEGTYGKGSVWVKLRVEVRQGENYFEKEHEEVNEIDLTAPGDREGSIYYVGAIEGKTDMKVNLVEDQVATIFVTCEVHAETQNSCRVFVDLGSDENCYFRVPKVEVAPYNCPFTIWDKGVILERGVVWKLRDEIVAGVIQPKDIEEELKRHQCLPGPRPIEFRPALKPRKRE